MLIARKDWVPLLHGEERPRVLQLVAARARRIARLLLDVGVSPTRIREVDTSPILFGPVAVGMAYLHAVLAEPIFEEAALCAFGAALNAVATITSPSLHQGFLSLAWSSRQLAASGIVPLDPAGLQAIENEVGAQLSSLHRKLGVDLADGMAGVGLYALCHLSHEAATNWTEMIVARLKPSTVVTPQGATVALTPMSGPDRPQAHPPTFVLAMAHGSAGIATFLSTARAATNSANASALLDEFIRFIVAHRLPSGSFPSTVGFGARLDRSGSWCWGDSGFAVSLLNAAMATGREDLAQMACDSLSGLGPTYCGDIARLDTCLCHGTAGVMHVLNRFHQLTGITSFEIGAKNFLTETARRCAACGDDTPLAFRRANGHGGSHMVASKALLTGEVGVLAALAACCCSKEPNWDFLLGFHHRTGPDIELTLPRC